MKNSSIIYGKIIFLNGQLRESLLPRICLIAHSCTIPTDKPTKVTEMITCLLGQSSPMIPGAKVQNYQSHTEVYQTFRCSVFWKRM